MKKHQLEEQWESWFGRGSAGGFPLTIAANQALVERGEGCELEAVETPDRREPGFLDPPLDGPAFPFDHLQLGQAQQLARIVDLFLPKTCPGDEQRGVCNYNAQWSHS